MGTRTTNENTFVRAPFRARTGEYDCECAAAAVVGERTTYRSCGAYAP